MLRVSVACAGLTLASWTAKAHSADRYVGGSNASDSNPGSAEHPWATLQRAADRASPGDVVNVRGAKLIKVVP